jgi:archaellum component FlaC
MPESQLQINQMILDELRGQRQDIQDVRDAVAELKGDVKHLKEGQEDITERLKALETAASRQISLDWKTVLKIVATLAIVALGASHGLPEGAWKALIGILGAG